MRLSATNSAGVLSDGQPAPGTNRWGAEWHPTVSEKSHILDGMSHSGCPVDIRKRRRRERLTWCEVQQWRKKANLVIHPPTHPLPNSACPAAPALIVELGLILAAWGPKVELLHGHQLWTSQLNISLKPQVDVFMWKTGVWVQLATQEFSKRFQMGSKHLKVTTWTILPLSMACATAVFLKHCVAAR